MGFVKIVKNKSYYKRFQVKFRRRREGKTDYQARQRLITQDKNKYDSPKHRLVVRFTNRDIIAQIIVAKIRGDEVLASAYAHELASYGLTVGLTNYSAAYCTGLLLARRVLKKLGLADTYKGSTQFDPKYNVKESGEKRPFYAILDVGLARTTTGARIFAALKGALDGGIEIPHKTKRFVGYDQESGELNGDVLRKYIFGGHVADYMRLLQEKDEESYRRQFSRFVKAGVKPDDLEAIYAKVHKAIRAKPDRTKKERTKPPVVKRWHRARITKPQRVDRIRQLLRTRGLPVLGEDDVPLPMDYLARVAGRRVNLTATAGAESEEELPEPPKEEEKKEEKKGGKEAKGAEEEKKEGKGGKEAKGGKEGGKKK